MKLSKRLLTALDYAKQHQSMIDVGSDHAHLAIKASLDYQISSIAIDNKLGPYQKAVMNVKQMNVEDHVQCKLQDGLASCWSDYEVIVLCGMGGNLICDILNRHDPSHLLSNHHLVLQPNTHIEMVRQWLSDHQFAILDETILEEQSKIYEVIYAKYDRNQSQLNELDIKFGPILRIKKGPIFMKKYQKLLKLKEESFQKMNQADTTLVYALEQEIKLLKRGLYED